MLAANVPVGALESLNFSHPSRRTVGTGSCGILLKREPAKGQPGLAPDIIKGSSRLPEVGR